MAARDVIVVGASAGGVEALSAVVQGLPADFTGVILVVLHVPADSPSVLPQILRRRCALPVTHARDGDPVVGGRVYVAPPNYHMLVHGARLRLFPGPRENGCRPAVDPLFRSAARAYGARVIGVVLSGTLDDGAAGLYTIKERGGLAVVQEPAEAMFASMPRAAMSAVAVDHVARAAELGVLLARLAAEQVVEREEPVMDDMTERELSDPEYPGTGARKEAGQSSGYTCPECHGALWERRQGGVLQFECRVGHVFSGEALLASQAQRLEAAIWTAVLALEEKAQLAERMSQRAAGMGQEHAARRFEHQARDARERAELIRKALVHRLPGDLLPDGPDGAPATTGDSDGMDVRDVG